MNRQQKEQVVSELQNHFGSSQAAFLVGYKGLSVPDLQSLRRSLRSQGGTFKVAKARLMKRAAHGAQGVEEIIPFCNQQVGLVFVNKETPAVAKTLVTFAKDHQGLKIVAGYMEKRIIDAKTVVFLASLPSREVLLAQLCGVLKAPVAALARVLHAASAKGSEETAVEPVSEVTVS